MATICQFCSTTYKIWHKQTGKLAIGGLPIQNSRKEKHELFLQKQSAGITGSNKIKK